MASLVTPPSSVIAYRQGVIDAIKAKIPVGVAIEKHDGYFDEETISRLALAAPAVYVAVMHARPVTGATHYGNGQQHFTLDTVCFVVTTHQGAFDASDIAWAIGETIANLAVLNAFNDATMPALNVSIENLWSNKGDRRGLALLSVSWNNDLLLGTDWATLSQQLLGLTLADTFPENPTLTVNESIGSVDGTPSQSDAFDFIVNTAAPIRASAVRQIFNGFGQIRYAVAAGSGSSLDARVRTQLAFAIDPTQTQDFLNAPFKGALSFDGSIITPRALDDAMFVLVNLTVTSSVTGGAVRFDIDVGSTLGPTGSATEILFEDAGVPERVTGILYVQTLTNFMANGAKLYIKSTVPITIVSESVVLIPQSTHPSS